LSDAVEVNGGEFDEGQIGAREQLERMGSKKWATSFGTRMNRGSETDLKKWDWKDSRIESRFGGWDWNDWWIEIDDVARSRGFESGIGLFRFCFQFFQGG
jgi:hypothetical protein